MIVASLSAKAEQPAIMRGYWNHPKSVFEVLFDYYCAFSRFSNKVEDMLNRCVL